MPWVGGAQTNHAVGGNNHAVGGNNHAVGLHRGCSPTRGWGGEGGGGVRKPIMPWGETIMPWGCTGNNDFILL